MQAENTKKTKRYFISIILFDTQTQMNASGAGLTDALTPDLFTDIQHSLETANKWYNEQRGNN